MRVKNIKRNIKIQELRLKALKAGFRTLKELASAVGVSYHHMTMVWTGERTSKRCIKKINEVLKNGPPP